MFESQRKSRSQHCERSELHLHFEMTKLHQKCQKWRFYGKPKASGQKVVPDKSILIGQKLVENAKVQMRHFE